MAKKPVKEDRSGKRGGELVGIVSIGASILVGLAVFTFDPADPSWGAATSSSDIGNWIGRFGAYLSDGLFQIIGGGALLIPFYLLVYGVNKAAARERGHRALKTVGALILIVSAATLMRLASERLPIFDVNSGGLVGEIIATKLLYVFGTLGSYTLMMTAMMVGLAISTKFSLMSLYRTVLWLYGSLHEQVSTLLIKRTERKRRDTAREERADTPPPPEPEVVEDPRSEASGSHPAVQEALPLEGPDKGYKLPPVSMLDDPPKVDRKQNKDSLVASANMLEKRIRDFGVEGRITQVHTGPVVTMYEFEPAPGVKVARVASLEDDLALAMRAESVRIVAPIPGKAAVGLEIPKNIREDVYLKEIITSREYTTSRSHLTMGLGKDIYGNPVVADMAKMPHLLVAGATGAGKSVAINTMTMSLLMNSMPRDLRMVMVDPKRLELSVYDGIPHLLEPVITEPRRAAAALRRLVVVMEERYKLLAAKGVRNIEGYNAKIVTEHAHPKLGQEEKPEESEDAPRFAVTNDDGTLPYIVVIIDELADLMMVAAKEVEDSIARLAQMARASGIHLLLATQRPSVDVLTGVIKANFPARMSFQVSSKTDSRTILDANGAEALLGKGDMLFLPPGTSKLVRIHGSYVSEDEISKVVAYLKKQSRPRYDLFSAINPPAFDPKNRGGSLTGDGGGERDERYEKAVELVVTAGKASASLLQRRMRIGYPTASRIIEQMEEEGIIGPKKEGGKEREVLVKREGPSGVG
jgi:S-DNA-T family DNA segregation ATPase FtsK/SpoIIIE